jgi:hypothetical protein
MSWSWSPKCSKQYPSLKQRTTLIIDIALKTVDTAQTPRRRRPILDSLSHSTLGSPKAYTWIAHSSVTRCLAGQPDLEQGFLRHLRRIDMDKYKAFVHLDNLRAIQGSPSPVLHLTGLYFFSRWP